MNCFSVCHVKVIGNPLVPKFDVHILNAVGEAVLMYYPHGADDAAAAAPAEDEAEGPSGWHAFAERFRQMRAGGAWNHVLLNALLGNLPPEEDEDYSDDDYGGEELFED